MYDTNDKYFIDSETKKYGALHREYHCSPLKDKETDLFDVAVDIIKTEHSPVFSFSLLKQSISCIYGDSGIGDYSELLVHRNTYKCIHGLENCTSNTRCILRDMTEESFLRMSELFGKDNSEVVYLTTWMHLTTLVA